MGRILHHPHEAGLPPSSFAPQASPPPAEMTSLQGHSLGRRTGPGVTGRTATPLHPVIYPTGLGCVRVPWGDRTDRKQRRPRGWLPGYQGQGDPRLPPAGQTRGSVLSQAERWCPVPAVRCPVSTVRPAGDGCPSASFARCIHDTCRVVRARPRVPLSSPQSPPERAADTPQMMLARCPDATGPSQVDTRN